VLDLREKGERAQKTYKPCGGRRGEGLLCIVGPQKPFQETNLHPAIKGKKESETKDEFHWLML